MVKIRINNKEEIVKEGISIIKACEQVGEKLSRFCYNERLKVSGNCRMCMVEVKGVMKPVIGCVEKVREGMEVFTNTESVKKSKEGVMEMILKNHPIDCPICDQGGECDLQDESIRVGTEVGRFYKKSRREVREKDLGILVKTEMKRCIQCTRCVRFMTEITGVEELGMVGRGEGVEISKYSSVGLKSKLQGNIIDLCPVGICKIR